MRKSALFLLLIMLCATPSFAQTTERGGPDDFGAPSTPDSDPFGTPPPAAPDPGGRDGLEPCPPGTIPPDDRGGLGEPGLEEAPGDRQLEQRELPPPGGVPPNPPGSAPGNQGDSFDQPGMGGQDQFGATDCPPGTDRGGGLDQGDALGDPPGQDVPGSERETLPPLLPPAGGIQ